MIIENNNPYSEPSFSLGNRIARQVWSVVWLLFFRPSPRPFHAWRNFLLKVFGASIGRGTHVYPGARIWAPWNLETGVYVGIADGVIVYNMDRVTIGDFSVVSQGGHLCGGSHDYNSKNFQLYARPIVIGKHVWLCADSFVAPGVTVADGVVVGARSVVTKPLADEWSVYVGQPAVKVKERERHGR